MQNDLTKAASLPQHPRRRRIESSDDESVKVVIGKKTDPGKNNKRKHQMNVTTAARISLPPRDDGHPISDCHASLEPVF